MNSEPTPQPTNVTPPETPVVRPDNVVNFDEPQIDIRNLRTYQDDLKQSIEDGKISSTKIILAEQKRRQEQNSKAGPKLFDEQEKVPKSKNGLAILISIGLVLLGGIAIFLAVRFGLPAINREAPKNSALSSIVFIKPDQSVQIDTANKTARQIVGELRDEIKNDEIYSRDTIVEFNIIKQITKEVDGEEVSTLARITNADFFKLMSARADESLIRSFTPDIMFGAHKLDTLEPFIIMRVSFFEQSFAGMLDWERNMIADVRDIFFEKLGSSQIFLGEEIETPQVIEIPNTATSTGTSTAATAATGTLEFATTTEELFENFATSTDIISEPTLEVEKVGEPTYNPQDFVDDILINKDVRAIKNSADQILFFYTFVDRETLVMATNRQTLDKLIIQLNVAKLVR